MGNRSVKQSRFINTLPLFVFQKFAWEDEYTENYTKLREPCFRPETHDVYMEREIAHDYETEFIFLSGFAEAIRHPDVILWRKNNPGKNIVMQIWRSKSFFDTESSVYVAVFRV